jgi:uncharacterized protein
MRDRHAAKAMQFTVNIEEIREKGLDYVRDLPELFLQEAVAGDLGFKAAGPGKLVGRFEKHSTRVLFAAKLELTVVCPCKRCLADVTQKLPLQFHLTFVADASARRKRTDEEEFDESVDTGGTGGPDAELQASFNINDVDTEPFDGHHIELDPLLREQIVLGLPLDVLHAPDCKGLCVVCGQDRNTVDCGHDQKTPDPRWAELGKLKLKN